MSGWQILNCDALAGLREMDSDSVQCCVTSPPYWGLRDYGTAKWDGGNQECDHQKATKVGSASRLRSDGREHVGPYDGEKAATFSVTPYLDACGKCGARRVDDQLGLEATPELYVARVVEIFREVRRVLRADGTLWLNLGDSYSATTKGSGGHSAKQDSNQEPWLESRKHGIAPGLKPKDLVGIPWRVAFALQADGWWLRSEIIWHKPNPMPESVIDRPTKAHEQVFLLSKSERYHYDSAAIAEKAVGPPGGNTKPNRSFFADPIKHRTKAGLAESQQRAREAGGFETRNKRTVWTVASEPFADAHFAVMPQALVEPCVLAGSKPGTLVLDPFAGSGTVGVVSMRHGRSFVGLELSATYADMARRRIGGPLFANETA